MAVYRIERIYDESSWAVRRWDGFNGRRVTPLSFCQFWRTVLLYATIKQGLLLLLLLLRGASAPLRPVVRTAGRMMEAVDKRVMDWEPSLSLTRAWGALAAAGLASWRVTWRGIVLLSKGLWALLFPVRWASMKGSRPVFRGAVGVGEALGRVADQDKTNSVMTALSVVLLVVAGAYFYALAWLASWELTLIGTACVFVLGFIVGFSIKLGILGLLWQAAVAAKHGVCPPVTIVRRANVADR